MDVGIIVTRWRQLGGQQAHRTGDCYDGLGFLQPRGDDRLPPTLGAQQSDMQPRGTSLLPDASHVESS